MVKMFKIGQTNSLTFINKFSIIVCNYFFEGEVSPNGRAAAWKAVGG